MQLAQSPLNILVVDDEPNIRKALSVYFDARGHHVTAVGNVADAMRAALRQSFDLAFVDLVLGRDTGLDLLPKLAAECPRMKVIVITAYATIDSAVESMKRGAADYLPKPFTPDQLSAIMQRACETQALERRVAELESVVPSSGLIPIFHTRSPAMQRALDGARKMAASSSPVLITGESGTGKSVLARAIHAWSPRKDKPFSLVTCGAMSAERLAIELFGAKRGVGGLTSDRAGRIADTERGTLLLDDVHRLPAELYAPLLRLLTRREYERVGNPTVRTGDVRIIASSTGDLTEAVAAGQFDRQLLTHLGMLAIRVPPLRERSEDIPDIARQLLTVFDTDQQRAPRQFTPDALAALSAHAWPGNITELRNVIERAVILSNGPTIGAEQLGSLTGSKRPPGVGDAVTLETLEEMHIRAVLEASDSIEQAARTLGIDTVTLWRRRKRYGL